MILFIIVIAWILGIILGLYFKISIALFLDSMSIVGVENLKRFSTPSFYVLLMFLQKYLNLM